MVYLVDKRMFVDLFIPNNEAAYFFKSTVLPWLAEEGDEEENYGQIFMRCMH